MYVDVHQLGELRQNGLQASESFIGYTTSNADELQRVKRSEDSARI